MSHPLSSIGAPAACHSRHLHSLSSSRDGLQLPLARRTQNMRSSRMPAHAIGNLFKSKDVKRAEAKGQLLAAIEPLQRGVNATEDTTADVERLAAALEKLNPTSKPLSSPLINGRWELIYTTSSSILGKNKLPFLRPTGPIYQLIDAETLRAANEETTPFFNKVSAELTPESDSRVAVKFKQFKLFNTITVNAPDTARGWLDTTYLDEEMRISRGDKGNLFVLLMDNNELRPDA